MPCSPEADGRGLLTQENVGSFLSFPGYLKIGILLTRILLCIFYLPRHVLKAFRIKGLIPPFLPDSDIPLLKYTSFLYL